MRVATAPEDEDIARENWSNHEQKAPPHALRGMKAKVAPAVVQGDKDAGRAAAAA